MKWKKNFPFADHVLYLPFDFFSSIRLFIDSIQPKMVFWVRYEFWLNTLEYLKEKSIPLILLNGVFRNNISFLYKPYLKSCLRSFSEIAVINKTSQENLGLLPYLAPQLFMIRDLVECGKWLRIHLKIRLFNISLSKPKGRDLWQHLANDDEILKTTIRDRDDIHWIQPFSTEVDGSRIAQLLSVIPMLKNTPNTRSQKRPISSL